MAEQQFLDGWNRAEQDAYIGEPKRRNFIEAKSDQYLEGYYAFWAARDAQADNTGSQS